MKKKITAIILILSIVTSLFAVSAISISASTLKAPTVSATIASNGIGVKWNNIQGAKGYCLYIGCDNKWIGWKYVSPSEHNYYLNKYGHYPIYKGTLSTVWFAPHTKIEKFMLDLTPTKEYFFQVNTCDINGCNLGKWSNVFNTPPYLPSVQKFDAVDSKVISGSANIGWSIISSSNNDGIEILTYQLVRCDNKNKSWKTVFEGSVAGHPMDKFDKKWFVYFTDRVSQKGQSEFYYQIRPYITTKNQQRMYGVWSKVLTVKA